jgi:indolepyruvate ferredoxin oxidoreductase, beta subunit
MDTINIYMCGVGGQGIGVLSEVMVNSCLAAGLNVKSVDTHGLAQRGGLVSSHLRVGARLFTPRVDPGTADLVIALERLEALRATVRFMKPGGAVVYYDSEMQPIHVRLGRFAYPAADEVAAAAQRQGGRAERVYIEGLPDPRMQNTAVLGRVAALSLIPGVTAALIEEQLRSLLKPSTLEENMAVFHKAAGAVGVG